MSVASVYAQEPQHKAMHFKVEVHTSSKIPHSISDICKTQSLRVYQLFSEKNVLDGNFNLDILAATDYVWPYVQIRFCSPEIFSTKAFVLIPKTILSYLATNSFFYWYIVLERVAFLSTRQVQNWINTLFTAAVSIWSDHYVGVHFDSTTTDVGYANQIILGSCLKEIVSELFRLASISSPGVQFQQQIHIDTSRGKIVLLDVFRMDSVPTFYLQWWHGDSFLVSIARTRDHKTLKVVRKIFSLRTICGFTSLLNMLSPQWYWEFSTLCVEDSRAVDSLYSEFSTVDNVVDCNISRVLKAFQNVQVGSQNAFNFVDGSAMLQEHFVGCTGHGKNKVGLRKLSCMETTFHDFVIIGVFTVPDSGFPSLRLQFAHSHLFFWVSQMGSPHHKLENAFLSFTNQLPSHLVQTRDIFVHHQWDPGGLSA